MVVNWTFRFEICPPFRVDLGWILSRIPYHDKGEVNTRKLNKSKFRISLPLSLLVVPLLLLVPAASATSSTKGYGTFIATITSATVISTYNGYTTYTFNGSDAFQGLATGTAVFQLALVVAPNGHDMFTGNFVCSACTYAGVAGTFSEQFVGHGIFGGNGAGQGILTGSGGLAGLTSVDKFQSTSTATGFTGAYEGVYSFGSTT
jgi:hypothetical protein